MTERILATNDGNCINLSNLPSQKIVDMFKTLIDGYETMKDEQGFNDAFFMLKEEMEDRKISILNS